jgi:hypothetical protein
MSYNRLYIRYRIADEGEYLQHERLYAANSISPLHSECYINNKDTTVKIPNEDFDVSVMQIIFMMHCMHAAAMKTASILLIRQFFYL